MFTDVFCGSTDVPAALRELSPAHHREPLLRRSSPPVRSLRADPKAACLEMGDMI